MQLLEALDRRDYSPSQRDLASRLNVSVGLINAFVKRLVKKGYIKVRTIPKNRVLYLLTPKGIVEKTRLTYKHIHDSYSYYKKTCGRLEKIYADLEREGCRRIAFYGISDIAELAYHVLNNSQLLFSGIIDDEHAGGKFIGNTVCSINEIYKLKFDRLLITNFEKVIESKDRLSSLCNSALWVYF